MDRKYNLKIRNIWKQNHKFFNLFAAFVLTFSSLVSANPQQGQIISGQVQINTTGNHMQINQSTPRAIINWRTFNIGQQESVHFQQPHGGAALNRINANYGASQIFGRLTATGQLILINGAGIYFGPSAFVNVGGLIATTGQLSNSNFLKGNYQFENADVLKGKIINEGRISAKHGLVALVGTAVRNDGVIEAELGTIVLASANYFTINFTGDGLINFAIKQDAGRKLDQTGVTNTGILKANGGKILITAQGASTILDHTINMQGIAETKSFMKKNGEIILLANEQTGKILIKGKLLASGKGQSDKGGKVKIIAHKTILEAQTKINVSGDTGGGDIYLYGTDLKVAPEANLLANALISGKGGKITLFGKNTTEFLGNVEAKGAGFGDGGFIEVSGKNNLLFGGNVDTTSTFGKVGTLLIDPKFLIIANSGNNYDGITNLFSDNSSGTTTITPSSINAVNSNIILQANSDVIFNDALNMTGNGLTLQVEAGRSILINQSISTQNGQISLIANSTNATSADRSITNIGNPVGDTETINGNILMASGTSISAGNADVIFTIGSTDTSPFSPGDVGLSSITANNVAVNTPNSIFVNGPIQSAGSTSLIGTNGTVELNNTIQANGIANTIQIVTNTFINNVGPSVLSTGAGYFHVWSGSPTNDTIGGLVHNFKQYNAVFGVTTPLGIGNGFLYLEAPFISAQLIGSISKIYNQTTTASLTTSNYQTTGIIAGDTVQMNFPSVGVYDNKNVGVGKNVSVSGISIVNATNNGVDVFGYQLTSPNASAHIGTITPKSLTAQLTGSVSKVYNTNTNASLTGGNYTLSGVISGDAVVLNNPVTGTYNNASAGLAKLVTVNGLTLLGADANNYALTSTSASAAIGTILPATVTASLTGSVNKVYDTTTLANISASNVQLSGVLGTDQVTLIHPATGQYNNANVGINKLVTLVGLTLSGSSASNYQLAANSASAAIGTITPATLTPSLTGSISKVYDTTTVATIGAGNVQLAGVLGADQVTLNHPSTGTYNNANVGVNKLVSLTGLSISGSSAGNYQLATTNISDTIGQITPATLTASLTGSISKVYDTTTVATIGAGNVQFTGVLGTDQVTLNHPATGQYNNANVGINKLVTLTGLSLSGSEAGNYQIANSISAAIGTITPATLTASLTGTISKVYDTTTAATIGAGNVQLAGVLGADQVTLNHPTTGQYDTANVGINKLVTLTGLSLSGSGAGNYQLIATTLSDTIGQITPAALTASLTGTISKVYDTTTAATIGAGNVQLGGVLGADQVSLNHPTTGQYDNEQAGINKLVTLSGLSLSGSGAGNYQLIATTISDTIGQITPATLTVSLTGTISKVYNATTAANIGAGNVQFTGVLGTDQVTLNHPATGQYNNANVGINKLVTLTGLSLSGSDAGNYQIANSISAAIGTITPATLTASLTGTINKVYDTTTVATIGAGNVQLAGVLGADQVTLNHPSTGAYNNANVGSNKLVSLTGLSLSGSGAGNYQLATINISDTIGQITPATLTASLTGSVSKVYDTTTVATIGAGNVQFTGVLGTDQVTLNHPATGQYNNANVGVNKLVTLTGLSLSGSDAGNYQLANSISAAIGTITPATLTASLTGTISKVYDTTTAATIGAGNVQLAGVLGADQVTLNHPTMGQYNTANVGINKLVTLTGLSLSGSKAGNYQLATTTVSDTIGQITPAALTASLTGTISKVYDTTTAATISAGNVQLAGVLGADQVTLNHPTTGQYNNAQAGINKLVTLSGLSLSGSGSGNYQLIATTISDTIGQITPATLTASLTGTISKVYNATTSAIIGASNVQLAGVLAGDQIILNHGTGHYNDANVGVNKLVTLTGLSLSGSDAGNYQLANSVSAPIGQITPATLTASLTGNITKVYDTTAIASVNANNVQLAGVFGADHVVLNHSTLGQYNDANVGINKLVTLTGLSLSGSAATNYQLSSTQATGNIGQITPAQLTASLTGPISKIYDATTIATIGANNIQLAGVLGADQITLNHGTGHYNDANVGINKLVTLTGLSLSGSAAANYQLASSVTAAIGEITPATLTASLTGFVSKVYDTNTVANIDANNVQLNGVLGSDQVSISNVAASNVVELSADPMMNLPFTGQYNNANVGTDKLVTLTGLGLTGRGAGNYQLASNTVTGIGRITPALVRVHGITVADKKFDGNLSASLRFTRASLTGVLGNDQVSLNTSGILARFATATVGNNIPVTISNLRLSGNQAQNYRLAPLGKLFGNIFAGQINPPVNPPPIIDPTIKPPVEPTPNIIDPHQFPPPKTIVNPPEILIDNRVPPNVISHIQFNPVVQVPRRFERFVPQEVPFRAPKLTSDISYSYQVMTEQTNFLNALLLAALLSLLAAIFFARRKRQEELTTLSFKLRTGLESIIGFSQVVKDNHQLGILTQIQNEWLENILAGSKGILEELKKVEAENIFSPDSKMAFQLRTALNDIKGFAELIYDAVGKQNDFQQKMFLSYILNGSDGILQLVPNNNIRVVK